MYFLDNDVAAGDKDTVVDVELFLWHCHHQFSLLLTANN